MVKNMLWKILRWAFKREWRKEYSSDNVFKIDVTKDSADNRDYEQVVKSTLPLVVDFSNFCPPVKNQGVIGSCFPSDQEVLTGTMEYKSIKDVTIGEKVITHTGESFSVLNKFNRIWQGNIFEIKSFGSYKNIKSTPEHPFLTQRGWVKAKELTKNDYLCFVAPKNVKEPNHPLLYDPDFLWLLGFYIAEGSIYKAGKSYRVSFSIHANEENYANKIKYICNKYNVDVSDDLKKDCLSRTIRFSNTYLALALKEFGRCLCDKKMLSREVMFLKPNCQLEILKGWQNGDGNQKINKGQWRITTTSKVLADQMQIILFRNDIFGRIIIEEQEKKKKVYRLLWSNTQKETYRHFKTSQGIFVNITSIKKYINSCGNVYNLSVDNDNSYIVHGRAVHNCGSHALITGVETLNSMKRKDYNIPLSELFHYFMVRGEGYENTFPKDSGQHGRNAMRLAKNLGCVPEKLVPYVTSKYNSTPNLLLLVKSMARFWKLKSYNRCYSTSAIKTALNMNRLVWLGVPIDKTFIRGKLSTYNYNKSSVDVGGHAFLVVGYNSPERTFKIVNSWGLLWGQKGFSNISEDYLSECPWFDAWAFDIK